eukprot:COSAG04_NODE_7868_length_1054_cov_1.312042_2_plen_96_part_00
MRATSLEAENCFGGFAQVNLGGKNIYMCSLLDLDNPIELAFMARKTDHTFLFVQMCTNVGLFWGWLFCTKRTVKKAGPSPKPWVGFLHKHLLRVV